LIDSNKNLKVLVVGLGSISYRHRKNLKFLNKNIHITALSSSGNIQDQNIDFADEVISTFDDDLNHKTDFAIVASPATFHLDYAKKLLYSKIPCLIEKPLASNLHDAEKIIRIQKETNTFVNVGYCLRYMTSAIKMKEILEQNIIGKIYNIFVNVGQFLPDWRPTKKYQNTVSANKYLGGGVLLELSHEIDYIQWLFGSIKVKYAKLRSSKELNLDVEDSADILFELEREDVLCNLHLDFLQKKAQRTCSIIGEKGRLDWDLIQNTIKFHDKEISKYIFYEKEWNANQMYIDLLKNFIYSIKSQNSSSINLKQSLKVLETIDNIKSFSIMDSIK
jgi:predicted dehydrogenase